jgi:tetratricopeptide (TPR) repeat protein
MGTSRFRAGRLLVSGIFVVFLAFTCSPVVWAQGGEGPVPGARPAGLGAILQLCCSGLCGLLSFFFGSIWGLLIIAYFAFPWVRDRLWGLSHSRSFLSRQKSALINPVDADARFQLGYIYLRGRNYRKAASYFEECLHIFEKYPNIPKDSHVYAALGHALYHLKRYDAALKIYEQGLALDPNLEYGDVHLGVANCYRLKGDQAQAKDWFMKTLKTNESLAEAAYRLAVIADREGKRDERETYLAHCLDIVQTSPKFIKKKNTAWGWRARFFALTKGWK